MIAACLRQLTKHCYVTLEAVTSARRPLRTASSNVADVEQAIAVVAKR